MTPNPSSDCGHIDREAKRLVFREKKPGTVLERTGWGGRIRTSEWRDQNRQED
jgi:hypothetical protein